MHSYLGGLVIVLDESFSSGLLSAAADEGLVEHASGSPVLYEDPTTKRYLQMGMEPQVRSNALWDVLLHFPAVVTPFDNLRVDKLMDTGLLKGPISSEVTSEVSSRFHQEPEVIKSLDGLVTAELKDAFPDLKHSSFAEHYLEVRSSSAYAFDSTLEAAKYELFDTYEEFLSGTTSMWGGQDFFLPGKRGGSPVDGDKVLQRVLGNSSKAEFDAALAYRSQRRFVRQMEQSANRWLRLVVTSQTYQAPIGARLPPALLSGVSRLNDIGAQAERAARAGSTHIAIRIWLEEIDTLPQMKSVADVLRLREDRRVDAFREAKSECTQALATGGPLEEAKLRRHIKTANRELAGLKTATKLSGFWTFASIPLDMLFMTNPVMTQVPLPVTGLIGAGITLGLMGKQSKLDWLMFGRS